MSAMCVYLGIFALCIGQALWIPPCKHMCTQHIYLCKYICIYAWMYICMHASVFMPLSRYHYCSLSLCHLSLCQPAYLHICIYNVYCLIHICIHIYIYLYISHLLCAQQGVFGCGCYTIPKNHRQLSRLSCFLARQLIVAEL